MNQDTIERLIKALGKTSFDPVVALVMEKVFNKKAVDVDGKGDGGIDLRFYTNEYNNRIGVQKTVQNDNWEKKFYDDAKKASEFFKITQMYFFTTHIHEQKQIQSVKDKIFNELGVSSDIYGAKEIAGFIINEKLITEFARAIGLDLSVQQKHEIDRREVLLHTYYALSSDRRDLQNEICESSLLAVLAEGKNLTRELLIATTAELLNIDANQDNILNSRIDSLLALQKICKDHKTGYLVLSEEMGQNILMAKKIYDEDMRLLQAGVMDFISSNGGSSEMIKMEEVAILLAKSFVQMQLENANTLSLSLNITGFVSTLDAPLNQIKVLLAKAGIQGKDINKVLLSITDIAKENALIQKLSSAVVYMCLRNIPAHKSAIILKTDNWGDVKTYLDSSVAIPYITSKIFGPSIERFSRGSNYTINMLSKLGSQVFLTRDYLNECAAHLAAASKFCCDSKLLDSDFAYSRNGYVAHYFQLKESGGKAPKSLEDYIRILSPNVFHPCRDYNVYIFNIMQDLWRYFKDSGLCLEDCKAPNIADRKKQFEIPYSSILMQDKYKGKTDIQVNHDMSNLAYMDYVSENDAVVFLTWDRGIMQLCREENKDSFWVVNPVAAADLIQASNQVSDMTLLSLGHRIARTMHQKEEIAGHIIDKIVEYSCRDFKTYECQSEIQRIKEKAFQDFDEVDPGFNLEEFERETYRRFVDAGYLPSDVDRHQKTNS